MSARQNRPWLPHSDQRTRLAAVAVLLVMVALAVVVGAAMTRAEPDRPDLPTPDGMERVAAGSLSIPIRELEYEDATSDVYTSPAGYQELFRYYTQDVTVEGWTLISALEDAEGSAVVYLTKHGSVVMLQIMSADVARERQIAAGTDLNLEPRDIDDAQSVLIVGQFRCTDESGAAVCIDYIVQG